MVTIDTMYSTPSEVNSVLSYCVHNNNIVPCIYLHTIAVWWGITLFAELPCMVRVCLCHIMFIWAFADFCPH